MASSVHIYHVALAFAFSQYAHVLFFFYLDGHEKPEQQARRKTYIAQINEVWPRVVKTYDAGHLLSQPGHIFTDEEQTLLGCKLNWVDIDGVMTQETPVAMLYHDESTFYRLV